MAATVLKQEPSARTELPLPNFGVRGFRAFGDLQIGELGRVNLFVGLNNAGKTSLLEAIHLYAGGANPQRIRELLVAREEITSTDKARVELQALDAALGRLFHAGGESQATVLTVGPLDDADRVVSVQRGWATTRESGDSDSTRFSPSEADDLSSDHEPAIELRRGLSNVRVIADRHLLGWITARTSLPFLYPSLFIPAGGISTENVASYWDRVALTDEEDLATAALRILAPGVERISVVGDADGPHERRVMVRVKGQATPVPLRTMGDGMNRLLGIVLALAVARDGILLIDEIENGLHYSVQADVWRAILRAAESLNVQVFATTHSWDCIRAFAAATSDSGRGDEMLYRLDWRIAGRVRAVRYTAAEIVIAAEQQIEVR
jgi:predicted ATPase